MATNILRNKREIPVLPNWYTPGRIGIAYSLLYLLILLGSAYIFNLWLPTPTRNGLLAELSAWVNNLLWQPLLVYYYLNSRMWIIILIRENGKLLNNPNDLSPIYRRLIYRLDYTPSAILLFALTIIFTIFTFLANRGDCSLNFLNAPLLPWWAENPIIFYFASPLVLFSTLSGFSLIYRLIIYVLALNELFKKPITINPWSKSGGLEPIRKFQMRIGILLAVIAFMLCLGFLQARDAFLKDGLLLLNIGIFIVISLFIFFAPIFDAHKAMLNYKMMQKQIIADQLHLETQMWFKTLQGQSGYSEEHFKKIDQLEKQMERIAKYPTWPLNTNIINYLGGIYAPLLPILIKVIVDIIIYLIKK